MRVCLRKMTLCLGANCSNTVFGKDEGLSIICFTNSLSYIESSNTIRKHCADASTYVAKTAYEDQTIIQPLKSWNVTPMNLLVCEFQHRCFGSVRANMECSFID